MNDTQRSRLFHVCPNCDYILAPQPGVPFDLETRACPGCGQRLELTPEQEAFWREVQSYISSSSGAGGDSTEDLTQADSDYQIPESLLNRMPRYHAFFLKVEKGTLAGKSIRLTRRFIVLGRTMGHILIPDRRVSRKHAQIEILSQNMFFIKDLASRNGTYVNDQRISYSRLYNGDRIRIGNTVFRFEVTPDLEAG